jgi:hypothetical protein
MKNKNMWAIVGIIILLIIAAAIIVINYWPKDKTDIGPIGGQTDIYGCLSGAGYSWNESIGACIREWELDNNQREAAKTAIMPLSYYVTIVEVKKQECEGCYNVKLQRNDNREMSETRIENWSFAGTDWNSENNTDDSNKTYCTQEQKKARACTMEYAPVCGWFNESIKCIKYPCAQTYSNKCMACAGENVAYWTNGECPK